MLLIHYYAAVVHIGLWLFSTLYDSIYQDFYLSWTRIGHGEFQVEEKRDEALPQSILTADKKFI